MHVIHVTNIAGNFYAAAEAMNKTGLSEFVLQMHHVGNYTLVVMRIPRDVLAHVLKQKLIW